MKDRVIGHKRYANPSRSLDMSYSPRNIVSGLQASHEAHRRALGQSPEKRCSQKQQCSEGNLLMLNGSKGVLEVSIVSRGWLRRRTRSGLTRMRGWIMGYGLNNLVITRYPTKVSLVK